MVCEIRLRARALGDARDISELQFSYHQQQIKCRFYDELKLQRNGTGYGGVTIVNLLPTGTTCPDLTTINQRVQILNSVATVVRDNCQDLGPSQIVSLSTVPVVQNAVATINGLAYQLESLITGSVGQYTNNLAGNYAPVMASSVLRSASFVDGVALDDQYFLAAYSQQPLLFGEGTQIAVRLYTHSGTSLTMLQEILVPVQSTWAVSDPQVLVGAYAFDSAHAVIMVREASPFGILSLVIKRTGNTIALTESNPALGNIMRIGGHPLDSTHFLLSYIPDGYGPLNNIDLQVVALVNEHLQFGSPLVLTNPQPPTTAGAPAVLAGASANQFEGYVVNTNVNTIPPSTQPVYSGLSDLVHFTVQVQGMTVAGGSNIALAGSSSDIAANAFDFVGNAINSLFLFIGGPSGGYMLGGFQNGIYQMPTAIPSGAGPYLGTMNLMGSENSYYGGRYYYRVPTLTGTRIFYTSSTNSSSVPQVFNTAFPRSASYNMSKLFISGGNLILIESDNSSLDLQLDGAVRVLTMPQ